MMDVDVWNEDGDHSRKMFYSSFPLLAYSSLSLDLIIDSSSFYFCRASSLFCTREGRVVSLVLSSS